jgi:hypothetical protein
LGDKKDESTRGFKRMLLFTYMTWTPLFPWLAYMAAKGWRPPFQEGVWVSLLALAYAFLHTWLVVEFLEAWSEW